MAVSRARSLGLKVYQGRLENAGFTDGLFDVVCLNHGLEHLPDPQVTMREIKRILKPDGIVYITVPNTRSLNFWLFGEYWYGLDIPLYVISYCPRELRFLCDDTGFEIIKIGIRSGAFIFVRSIKYVLEGKGENWPRWLHRINWPSNKLIRRTPKPFFIQVDHLRFGDTMVAALRKDHSGLAPEGERTKTINLDKEIYFC